MAKLKLKRTPAEENTRARKKAKKAHRSHTHTSSNFNADKREEAQDRGRDRRYYDDDDPEPGPSRRRTSESPYNGSHNKNDYDYTFGDDDDGGTAGMSFEDKMRSALEEDSMYDPSQRLDSVESHLNSYTHIPRRWRGTDEGYSAGLWMEDAASDIGLHTWQMNDDEYAEYIRAGMWRYVEYAWVASLESILTKITLHSGRKTRQNISNVYARRKNARRAKSIRGNYGKRQGASRRTLELVMLHSMLKPLKPGNAGV
jgi:hypothetical protein